MTKYEPIILIIVSMVLFGFILGWIFPIEGPIDYVYDNAIKKKAPVKVAPVQQFSLIFNINDMSEEDLEALQEILRNREGIK